MTKEEKIIETILINKYENDYKGHIVVINIKENISKEGFIDVSNCKLTRK